MVYLVNASKLHCKLDFKCFEQFSLILSSHRNKESFLKNIFLTELNAAITFNLSVVWLRIGKTSSPVISISPSLINVITFIESDKHSIYSPYFGLMALSQQPSNFLFKAVLNQNRKQKKLNSSLLLLVI